MLKIYSNHKNTLSIDFDCKTLSYVCDVDFSTFLSKVLKKLYQTLGLFSLKQFIINSVAFTPLMKTKIFRFKILFFT